MTVNRVDILINRIVDREASDADWAEVESLALQDGVLWKRLAEAQREHAVLCAGVEDALAVVDAVDLPRVNADAAHHFTMRWRVWGGWAVAATLALVWATTRGLLPTPGQPGGQTAGLTPVNLTTEQAFDEYMARGFEEGRILAELPTVMVNARRAEDDPQATDITMMRRVIELKRVRGAYRVGVDELGQLQLVPADPTTIELPPTSGDLIPDGGRP